MGAFTYEPVDDSESTRWTRCGGSDGCRDDSGGSADNDGNGPDARPECCACCDVASISEGRRCCDGELGTADMVARGAL